MRVVSIVSNTDAVNLSHSSLAGIIDSYCSFGGSSCQLDWWIINFCLIWHYNQKVLLKI
jgi:hypothetical protein